MAMSPPSLRPIWKLDSGCLFEKIFNMISRLSKGIKFLAHIYINSFCKITESFKIDGRNQ